MNADDFLGIVERGARYLDRQYPDWWKELDARQLWMGSPAAHIIALIRGESYYNSPEFQRRDSCWQIERGFEVESVHDAMMALNSAWVRCVIDRQKHGLTYELKAA